MQEPANCLTASHDPDLEPWEMEDRNASALSTWLAGSVPVEGCVNTHDIFGASVSS